MVINFIMLNSWLIQVKWIYKYLLFNATDGEEHNKTGINKMSPRLAAAEHMYNWLSLELQLHHIPMKEQYLLLVLK